VVSVSGHASCPYGSLYLEVAPYENLWVGAEVGEAWSRGAPLPSVGPQRQAHEGRFSLLRFLDRSGSIGMVLRIR